MKFVLDSLFYTPVISTSVYVKGTDNQRRRINRLSHRNIVASVLCGVKSSTGAQEKLEETQRDLSVLTHNSPLWLTRTLNVVLAPTQLGHLFPPNTNLCSLFIFLLLSCLVSLSLPLFLNFFHVFILALFFFLQTKPLFICTRPVLRTYEARLPPNPPWF